MGTKRHSRRSRRSSRKSRRRGNVSTRQGIMELLATGHKLTPAERRKSDALKRELSRPLAWERDDRDNSPDHQAAKTPLGTYGVGTFPGGRPGHLVLLGFQHHDGRRDLLGSFPSMRVAKAHAAKDLLSKAKWAALDASKR